MPLTALLRLYLWIAFARVRHCGIFASTREATPHALLHNLNTTACCTRESCSHRELRNCPYISAEERVACERLAMAAGWLRRALASWSPDVPHALRLCASKGLGLDIGETTFFVSRTIVVSGARAGRMALWRERLFAAMARNAGDIADYFQLPAERVVELGARVEI